jgi:hypothetical protein
MMVATGNAVIVILLVAKTWEHPPEAAMVLVTVYVPAVLAARLTSPVLTLTKTRPVADEKVPATPPPLKTGKGFVPLLQ